MLSWWRSARKWILTSRRGKKTVNHVTTIVALSSKMEQDRVFSSLLVLLLVFISNLLTNNCFTVDCFFYGVDFLVEVNFVWSNSHRHIRQKEKQKKQHQYRKISFLFFLNRIKCIETNNSFLFILEIWSANRKCDCF